MTLELLAFRHGETTLNAAGRVTGQLDPELTEAGRAQVVALAGVLRDRPIDLALHSGLRRTAASLALALGERTEIPIAVEPRFAERHLGEWQGQPRAVLPEQQAAGLRAPGGESYADVAVRVRAALAGLLNGGGDGGVRSMSVLLATHGGTLRVLRGLASPEAPFASLRDSPVTATGELVSLRFAAPVRLPAWARDAASAAAGAH